MNSNSKNVNTNNSRMDLINRILDLKESGLKLREIDEVLGYAYGTSSKIISRYNQRQKAQETGEDLFNVFKDELKQHEKQLKEKVDNHKSEFSLHKFLAEANKQLGISGNDDMVVLVSDLQVGKLVGKYNTEMAFKRVKEYTEYIKASIASKVPKSVTVAFLGDIIESSKKHPNSRDACDTHTNEQFVNAVDMLSTMLKEVKELTESLSIPFTAIGIAGNHDWDGNGIEQFKPGKLMLSYPLYTMMSRISGVNIVIPEGTCHIYSVGGLKIAFEHGVGVASNETAMAKRKASITEFKREFVDMYVMGDKHNVNTFNNCKYIVNGAFFGSTDESVYGAEYSAICGYNSKPSQAILYVRDGNVNCDIYYFKAI